MSRYILPSKELHPTWHRIAILVDGDNAATRDLQLSVHECSQLGVPVIKRVYGDWTSVPMQKWKSDMKKYAFIPKEVFSYTKSKNATDIALVIEAMDILHNNTIEGICIVSSDSDFTGLACRFREAGKFVMVSRYN